MKKYILLILLAIFINSCEVDGPPLPGDWKIMIVNSTNHDLRIDIERYSEGCPIEQIHLFSHDTIVRQCELFDTSIDLAHVPFNGLVSLVVEDSLSYLCSGNDSLSLQMFATLDNYVPILNGPDFYLFRYEITEEDYEYAKAHPYKPEEE